LVIDSLNRFSGLACGFFIFFSGVLTLPRLETTSHISIQFSGDSLKVLNLCLAIIMFGIALGIDVKDFRTVIDRPRSIVMGSLSQFILLPCFTFILVWIVAPPPAVTLGMILVAACPGGNVSNFISSLSRANIALSVSLTGIATLLCPLLTPLNFHFWAGLLPETADLLKSFAISFKDILQTVLLVLIFPLSAGIGLKQLSQKTAVTIEKPVKWLSFAILIAFIGVALFNNFEAFKSHVVLVFILVALHNAIAFATGYSCGKLSRLTEAECRSICIETGIQNSGLGLIIIFTFFGGDGGMALVAAWWGVWHIIAGLVLARYFNLKDLRSGATA
jgi:BASS family bile acid:Na+ symporter